VVVVVVLFCSGWRKKPDKPGDIGTFDEHKNGFFHRMMMQCHIVLALLVALSLLAADVTEV